MIYLMVAKFERSECYTHTYKEKMLFSRFKWNKNRLKIIKLICKKKEKKCSFLSLKILQNSTFWRKFNITNGRNNIN